MNKIANIGTLNIRIKLTGTTKVNEDLKKINKNASNLGSGGVLSKLNKFRWLLMSIQTAANALIAPFKLTISAAKASFYYFKTLLETSVIGPLKMAARVVTSVFIPAFAAGSAAVAAFTIKGVNDLAKLETAIMSAVPLFEFSSGGNIPGLKDNLLKKSTELATKYGVAIQDVGDAFYDFASAGINAETSLSAMEGATQFSIAAQMKLGDAVQFSLSTIRALGKYTGNASQDLATMTEFNDKMAVAVLQSQMRFTDLNGAMAQVGPVAGAVGIDIGSLSSAMAVLANSGVRGSTAGTVLKTVLSKLARNTGSTKKALDAMNLTINDFDLSDMGSTIELLTKGFASISDEGERTTAIFELLGNRGAKAARLFTRQGADEFKKFQLSMKDSTGAVDELVSKMLESSGFAINRIKQQFNAIGIGFAEAFSGKEGILKAFSERFQEIGVIIKNTFLPYFEKINEYLKRTFTVSNMKKWITFAKSGLDKILYVFTQIKDVGFGLFKGIFKGLNLGPVFEGFSSSWEKNKNSIINGITSIGNSIGRLITSYTKGVGSFFSGLDIVGTISNLAKTMNILASSIEGTSKTSFLEYFKSVGKTIKSAINKISEFINNLTKLNTKTGKSKLSSTIDSFTGFADAMTEAIGSLDVTAINSLIKNLNEFMNTMAKSSFEGLNSTMKMLSGLAGNKAVQAIVGGVVKHPVATAVTGATAAVGVGTASIYGAGALFGAGAGTVAGASAGLSAILVTISGYLAVIATGIAAFVGGIKLGSMLSDLTKGTWVDDKLILPLLAKITGKHYTDNSEKEANKQMTNMEKMKMNGDLFKSGVIDEKGYIEDMSKIAVDGGNDNLFQNKELYSEMSDILGRNITQDDLLFQGQNELITSTNYASNSLNSFGDFLNNFNKQSIDTTKKVDQNIAEIAKPTSENIIGKFASDGFNFDSEAQKNAYDNNAVIRREDADPVALQQRRDRMNDFQNSDGSRSFSDFVKDWKPTINVDVNVVGGEDVADETETKAE